MYLAFVLRFFLHSIAFFSRSASAFFDVILPPKSDITSRKGASGVTMLVECGTPPALIRHLLKVGTSARIPRPFKSSYK